MNKKNYEELKPMLDNMKEHALSLSNEYVHAKCILDEKPNYDASDPALYNADEKDFKQQTKYAKELNETIEKLLSLIDNIDDVARHRVLHSKSLSMDDAMYYND